jgi:hypothetical protein
MMKLKVALSVIALFTLTACIQSELNRRQEEHLKQYSQHITKALENYSKGVNSANGDTKRVLDIHLDTLKRFSDQKEHFSQFPEEERLQAIIGIYDTALSNLLIQQVEILELAKPLWSEEESGLIKFQKIKELAFYNEHQEKLSKLLVMLEDYKRLTLEHHEVVRKKLVASSLKKEEREQMWPTLNAIISRYLRSVKPGIRALGKKVEAEKGLAEFLYEHRNEYVVTQEEGVKFKDYDTLIAYQNKLRSYAN